MQFFLSFKKKKRKIKCASLLHLLQITKKFAPHVRFKHRIFQNYMNIFTTILTYSVSQITNLIILISIINHFIYIYYIKSSTSESCTCKTINKMADLNKWCESMRIKLQVSIMSVSQPLGKWTIPSHIYICRLLSLFLLHCRSIISGRIKIYLTWINVK